MAKRYGYEFASTPPIKSQDREGSLMRIPRDELPAHMLTDDFALAYGYECHVARPERDSNARLNIYDEKLLMCMKALGMASFATKARSPELAVTARKYYTESIQMINDALASPELSIQDSTLLAVVMLANFESISGKSSSSLSTWSQHVLGMAAIIELRGPEQLQTPEGRMLFMQSATCIIAQCVRYSMRVPTVIHRMMNLLSDYVEDLTDPGWRIPFLGLQFADLKSDVANGRIFDLRLVIEKLLTMEENFDAAPSNVSSIWSYETIQSYQADNSPIPPYIQIFQNSVATQLWNTMRAARILCHAYIIGTIMRLKSTSLQDMQQLQDSRSTIHHLRQDILSTVPQHLYLPHIPPYESDSIPYHEDSPNTPAVEFSRIANGPSNLPALRTPRSWLMLSHLVVAGRTAPPGNPVRKAIKEMMLLAGRERAMSHARIMVSCLAEDRIACFAAGYVNRPYEPDLDYESDSVSE